MDYLKYWTPVAVLAASIAGLLAGGNFVWIGIASFPILALLDTIVGVDLSQRRMSNALLANIPVWICSVGPLAQYFVLAWTVATYELSGWQMLGAVLSVAWLGVVPLVPASHELYHMRSPLSRFVGHYVQLCYLDCTRDIGHVINHHIDVATEEDGDTAKRGLDLYTFTGRSLVHSTLFAQKMEGRALRKRGMSAWNIRHRGYRALLALALFHAAIFAIGGWLAVGLAFAAQIVSNLKAFASRKFAADELGRSKPLGEVDLERFNVNGGSIAIGHPFGATGARVTVQLLQELRRRGGNLGLMTVCAAGGVGFAMVVERE